MRLLKSLPSKITKHSVLANIRNKNLSKQALVNKQKNGLPEESGRPLTIACHMKKSY